MRVSIPQDATKIVENLFEIMNSKENGIYQTYDKQLEIKRYFDRLSAASLETSLLEEFKAAMDLYIETHIEEWGFFGFDCDYFLSMIEY